MRARPRWLAALVFVLALVPFLPALEAGFVDWDDEKNFVKNPGFRGLGWAQLRWMFTTTLLGHYVPLTWLSLGLNYVLGGMNPFGYHLGNLLLHAANAAVLYFVARRLLAAAMPPAGAPAGAPAIEAGAVFAALVFAAHPLRAESVAWVTERRDVLSGLFYLLAVLAYLRGVERPGPLPDRRAWLVAAAFAAGLFSKAIVMTLPLTLLLLDAYPLRRAGAGIGPLLREKRLLLLLMIVGMVVAFVAQSDTQGIKGYDTYGLQARVGMVAYSLWFYPSRWLVPAGLSPLYELPPVVTLADGRFAGALAAVAAVTLALALARRRWPAGLAAWAHAAVAVAPVSGVVHAGYQLAHDRYSYLPGLGLAVLAGAGVAWLPRLAVAPWLRRLAAGAAALAVLGLGAATWRQVGTWHDAESLWRGAVAADPACALCAHNLGLAIVRSGRLDAARLAEAEALLRRAIVLRPERADPYYNLASVLVWQRRYEEAEPILRAYIRAFPDQADGPMRLGMLYRDRGRYADAIAALRVALAMDRHDPGARREMGLALEGRAAELEAQGRVDEARALRREADTLLRSPAGAPPAR